MSLPAAKRQKRGHDSTTRNGNIQTNGSAHPSGESDQSEEDIRAPGRRATRANHSPSQAKDRNLSIRRRGDEGTGLKQSALDFSKAKKPPPEFKTKSRSTVDTKPRLYTVELDDDFIEDDPTEDNGENTSIAALTSKARAHTTRRQGGPAPTADTGSQAFIKPSKVSLRTFTSRSLRTDIPASHLPWAQQYAPRTLDELGVHKRKVADIRSWIDNVLNGYEHKRLLILRGPSGSGKTATVKVLSSVLNFDILEWHNPLTNTTAWGEYRSGAASFEDFLSRGQRYGSLDLASSTNANRILSDQQADRSANHSRQIILMEEDPQSYSNNTTVLQNFRSSIQRYLQTEENASNASEVHKAFPACSRPPIVMVVSESPGASSGTFGNTSSAFSLLGPEILAHPRVTAIDFNPVATTILLKALELAISKAQRDNVSQVQLSHAILHKIAEGGDLRGAIGTIEFLSQSRESSIGTRLPLKSQARSRLKANQKITASEAALLEALAPRSSTLDLFHAVGKVVYNKRRPATTDLGTSTGSPNSATFVSDIDPDHLLDSTSHDNSTFTSAIHENYLLSCSGDDFVDTFNACSDALSLSDILSVEPFSKRSHPSFANAATDTANFRQTDLAAHITVRGVLRGLPYPVQRKGYPGGRDSFKMFWPESMRVKGRMDEVKENAKVWIAKFPPTIEERTGLLESMLLFEVPYRALIASARDGRELATLASIGQLSNSSWAASEAVADSKHVSRATLTNAKKRSGTSVDREDDEMKSFIQSVGETWILSDDDIED